MTVYISANSQSSRTKPLHPYAHKMGTQQRGGYSRECQGLSSMQHNATVRQNDTRDQDQARRVTGNTETTRWKQQSAQTGQDVLVKAGHWQRVQLVAILSPGFESSVLRLAAFFSLFKTLGELPADEQDRHRKLSEEEWDGRLLSPWIFKSWFSLRWETFKWFDLYLFKENWLAMVIYIFLTSCKCS